MISAVRNLKLAVATWRPYNWLFRVLSWLAGNCLCCLCHSYQEDSYPISTNKLDFYNMRQNSTRIFCSRRLFKRCLFATVVCKATTSLLGRLGFTCLTTLGIYNTSLPSAKGHCVSLNRSFSSFLLRHTATPMRQHHHR
jgi:hypothetical protein